MARLERGAKESLIYISIAAVFFNKKGRCHWVCKTIQKKKGIKSEPTSLVKLEVGSIVPHYGCHS